MNVKIGDRTRNLKRRVGDAMSAGVEQDLTRAPPSVIMASHSRARVGRMGKASPFEQQ